MRGGLNFSRGFVRQRVADLPIDVIDGRFGSVFRMKLKADSIFD
jgi:hypothetical protein